MTSHQLQYLKMEGTTSSIEIKLGEIIVVAGPNGVGKSALLEEFHRNSGLQSSRYIPGYRQIFFNNSWDIIKNDLRALLDSLYSGSAATTRHRDQHADDQFRLLLKSFVDAASYEAHRLLDKPEYRDEPPQRLFAKLNVIFETSNFVVRFKPDREKGIIATRGNSDYYIESLSDGERAALYLATAFLTLRTNTILFIDEPEKHLHPSISEALINACMRSRRDIAVVVATHDLNLIRTISAERFIHVTNSDVRETTPEKRSFCLNVIPSNTNISESLKLDILGARSEILFIEGQSSSDDLSLYRNIYPGVQIVAKGSCEQVIEAVRALRQTNDIHWVRPFGLIDADGRDEQELASLKSKEIYALPVPTVENLFFLDAAIQCFVDTSLASKLGDTKDTRLSKLEREVLENSRRRKRELALKLAEWKINRLLSTSRISMEMLRDGNFCDISVSPQSIIDEVTKEVDKVIENRDWKRILRKFPIKDQKSITNPAARALGAKNFEEYKEVILYQLEANSKFGRKLKASLESELPKIITVATEDNSSVVPISR